jgi:hypothetical protein
MPWGDVRVAGLWVFALACSKEPAAPPAPPRTPEWTSPEIAAQIIAEDGAPGPLFARAVIGQPLDVAEVGRIKSFVGLHRAEVELEATDGTLMAITFTGEGWDGEEARERAADRAGRGKIRVRELEEEVPPLQWIRGIDGLYLRGSMVGMRLHLSWTKAFTLDEILAFTEKVLDTPTVEVHEKWGWDYGPSIDGLQSYCIAVPWPGHDSPEETVCVADDKGRIAAVRVQMKPSLVEGRLREKYGAPKRDNGQAIWKVGTQEYTLEINRLTARSPG